MTLVVGSGMWNLPSGCLTRISGILIPSNPDFRILASFLSFLVEDMIPALTKTVLPVVFTPNLQRLSHVPLDILLEKRSTTSL